MKQVKRYLPDEDLPAMSTDGKGAYREAIIRKAFIKRYNMDFMNYSRINKEKLNKQGKREKNPEKEDVDSDDHRRKKPRRLEEPRRPSYSGRKEVLDYETSNDIMMWYPQEMRKRFGESKRNAAKHFGSYEEIQYHHILSRNKLRNLVNTLSPEQKDELGVALGIGELSKEPLTKQYQVLCCLESNLFLGPREGFEQQRKPIDPVRLQVEGKHTEIFTEDPRTQLYSIVTKAIDNEDETDITNEKFNIIKTCLVAAEQFHQEFLGGKEIDISVAITVSVGKRKVECRQVRQKDFDRMQGILEGMDIIKQIDGTANLLPDVMLARNFVVMDGKFSVVYESVIKNRGGLSKEEAYGLEEAIKNRFRSTPSDQRNKILEGFARRTGKNSLEEKDFKEYVHAYLRSLTTIDTAVDNRGRHKPLYAQYAAKILENNYRCSTGREEMLETIGGLPSYDAERILEDVRKNRKFDPAKYDQLQKYLRDLTRIDHVGISYGRAAAILANNYRFSTGTEEMLETIGGLPSYDAERILEDVRKNRKFDPAKYDQLQKYLRDLTRIDHVGISYGRAAGRFWKAWLRPDKNTIRRVEEKFKRLKGILSQEEVQRLGETIITQGKDLLNENSIYQMARVLKKDGKTLANYYKEFLTSLTEKGTL